MITDLTLSFGLKQMALTGSRRAVHETTRGPVETGRGFSWRHGLDPRTHQFEEGHQAALGIWQ